MAKILYAAGTTAHIRSFHTDYINALRSEGHEVLTMAKGEEADFDVPFQKKMLSLENLRCQSKIRRILKRECFDAIILNTTLAAFNIRMALPRRKRPRVLNLVHGYMFRPNPVGIKEKIFLFAEKFLRKRTDAIIVMNEEDLKAARDYSLTGGSIVKIRGMGAKVKEITVSPDDIRASLNSKNKFVISFTGEICLAKNQNMLISLLPRLKKEIPEIALWLMGAGGEKDNFERLAAELGVSDSVIFTDYVSNPCDYIAASDLYVTASKKEGLPFNVIEALGCEKTVIASDIKGHRDIIEDGENGFLFSLDNPEELVRKIVAAYKGELAPSKEKMVSQYKKFSKEEVFEETLSAIKEGINLHFCK